MTDTGLVIMAGKFIESLVSPEEIDRPIDMVDVFRRNEGFHGFTVRAIEIDAKVLCGQIGVQNDEAAEDAGNAGGYEQKPQDLIFPSILEAEVRSGNLISRRGSFE